MLPSQASFCYTEKTILHLDLQQKNRHPYFFDFQRVTGDVVKAAFLEAKTAGFSVWNTVF